jgi:RHS repeat-associated protein
MGIALGRFVRSRLVNRAFAIATCLVLVGMSVEPATHTVPPALAAAASSAPSPTAAPSAASLRAKKTPTEVPSLRTAYSNTYDNHDGTFTAEVDSSPIYYMEPGSNTYQPIDLTLSAVPGGQGRVRAGKSPIPVEIGAPDDAAGFVSADTGKGKISLSLAPGAKVGRAGSKPVTHGDRADVAGLMPGVDLRVLAGADGFRLFLTLASKPASSSFTFLLDAGGMTPTLGSDGVISFADKSGAVVATMPQPFAVDSTPNDGAGGALFSNCVSYTLAKSGSKYLLTVKVDPAWLATAVYPVYVDPSVSTGVSGDTFIAPDSRYTNFNTYARPDSPYYHEMYLGTDPNDATNVFYDLLAFPLPAGVAGSTIDTATLSVFPYHQWEHYLAMATWVDQITSSWSASKVTYAIRPSHTASITSALTIQGNMGHFNVTSIVAGWAAGTPNYGFELHQNGMDYRWWKRLIASEQGGSNVPSLKITYHTPIVSNLVPTAGAWTNSRTLSWAFADVAGLNQSSYRVEVATNSSFTSPIIDTGVQAGVATRYTIPTSTALTDGALYYWQVIGSNGSIWSPWVSGSFHWDASAPTWTGFTAPASQAAISGSSYTFAWSAAGGGAPIANYNVQLQSAPMGAVPNSCTSAWTNVGLPVASTAASYAATSLASSTCYRLAVSAKDSAGNLSGLSYSSAVLRDSTAPPPPVVLDDATPAPSVYGSSYTIYYRPSGARSITLTSVGADSESGIASSTFGALSAPTGWTYTAGTVAGNVATKTIAWTATAARTTLAITTTNNAGLVSSATTLTFVPLTGATADFLTPDEGTTSLVNPTTTLSVAWVETAGLTGITDRSLQRQLGSPGADGLCGATTWTNDGAPVTSTTPVSASGLTAETCYRWVLTLTDSTGSNSFNSGAVLVDGTSPVATIAYPEAGRPLSGSVVVTGTAVDAHLSGYAVDFGSGTAPASWTPIAASSTAVGSTGPLAVWATGGLLGVYTLRLTATDAAGNVTVQTSIVYIDNTQRGDDSYNTKVPFDLGGGWKLGVNVATGAASLARSLFAIASYGPTQALSLEYNSNASTGGQFGTGWSSTMTQYLSFESGFVVWHRADAGRVPFGLVGGAWKPLAGHYESLTSGSGACGDASGTCVITVRNQTVLTFEGAGGGRLLSVTDRSGNSLNLAWNGATATLTDASGRATTLALDTANRRITDVTDSAGRHWGFAYTGANLTAITDPASNVTTLTYNASNQLTGISRRRTPLSGSAQTITWGLGYNGSTVTSVTDPIGGAASPVVSSLFTYGIGATTVRLLRDASQPAAPAFNTSTYQFDAHGWVTSTTDADGWNTSQVFDANGNATSSTRQVSATSWATTSSTYDAAGNLTSTTDPLGAVTNYTYNSTNDALTQTEAWGTAIALTTANAYDSAGRLCRTVLNPTADALPLACTGSLGGNADQNIDTQYTYDAHGQLATQTNPVGVVTLYHYDAYGNRISSVANYVAGQADDSTSVATSDVYDQATTAGKAGYVTSHTAPVSTSPAVGRTTTYTYDVFGDVLSTVVDGDAYTPSGRTVDQFDEFGNLLSDAVYSPADASTRLSSKTSIYDARNRATSVATTSSVATSTTQTVFDVAGDALTVTSNDGITTTRTFDGLGQLVAEQSSGLDVTTHTYDGLGDLIATVAPAQDLDTTTTVQVFDVDGQLTSVTDDSSGTPETTTHTFDLLGRETQSVDPAGLVTTTTFDGAGRATRVTADTQITDTTYDKAGQPLTTTTPYAAGQSVVVNKTTYDPLGRPVTVTANFVPGSTDPVANQVTTNYYDAAGDIVAVVDPKGIVNRAMFDVAGEAIEKIANCTDVGTTPSGAPASCVGAGTHGDNKTNLVTTYAYTSTGTQTTSTSYVGNMATNTTVDGAGHTLSSIEDAGPGHLNLETDNAYDGAGRPVATRDPSGAVTVTSYDSQGRIRQVTANCTDTDPGSTPTNWAACSGAGRHDGTWNQVTTYQYDDAGHRISQTAPNGMVTKFDYDKLGNLITKTDHYVSGYYDPDVTVNVATNYYYDSSNNRIAVASPTSTGSYVITLDRYDSSGRLIAEIQNCTSSGTVPDANPATCTGKGTADATTNVVKTYSYDAAGNKTSVTEPSPANGATGTATVTTRYAYDANNQLCRVLENASVVLQTLADPCSTPVSGTTTTNVSTRYDYDPAGNLMHEYAPAPAGTTTYGYDAQGNLTSQTDPDNNTTTWTYDIAGNKASETDPDTAAGPTLSYAYDGANRLCRRVAASPGVVLQNLTNPCTDTVSGATIDTRYVNDSSGNVASATDALTGRAIVVTYDKLDRPLTVTGDATGDPGTSYTYDFTNPSRTDPSGIYNVSLDLYGRETALVDPVHPTSAFTWTYAGSGDLITAGDPTANRTTRTYDPLGRVTTRTTSGAPGCSSCAVSTLGYNNAGNIVSQTNTTTGDPTNGTTTYAYDPLSRLTTYTPAKTATQSYTWNSEPDRASISTGGAAAVTTTFDAAGRPTSDSSGGTYTYDKEGRLTSKPGQTLVWDALNRLTQVLAAPSGAVLASYTYDALDRLRTVTQSGVTTRFRYVGQSNSVAQEINDSTGAVIWNHATDWWGADLFDFNVGGSAQRFLGRNEHDDVIFTYGPTGAISSTAAYDPFGGLTSSTGAIPNMRWQGSWQDSVTGLYYVIARWYSPTLGTFLSEDPQVAGTDDPEARDPYAYASGDPVDSVDPSGEKSSCNTACRARAAAKAAAAAARKAEQEWLKKVRMSIGLPESTAPSKGVMEWLPVRQFSQSDFPDAVKDQLGGCPGVSIKSQGCALTSTAMLLNYYGVKVPGQGGMNPELLNAWWKGHKGFSHGCDATWGSKAMIASFRVSTYKFKKPAASWADIPLKYRTLIDQELMNGHPMIGWIGLAPFPKVARHYILIMGVSYLGDIYINDPSKDRGGTSLFGTTYGSTYQWVKSARHPKGKWTKVPSHYQLLGFRTFHMRK